MATATCYLRRYSEVFYIYTAFFLAAILLPSYYSGLKKQLAFRNLQQLVVVSFLWVVVLFVCLFIFVAACGGFFFSSDR